MRGFRLTDMAEKNTEIWKTIEGFPNYEVSNMGNVRSLAHRDKLNRVQGGRPIKPQFDGKGHYLHVGLHVNGVAKTVNVHRLVARAFIPNPCGYAEVNHKDENKTNNAASNLEWCTHEYNNTYGSKIDKGRGENNSICKATEKTVLFILKNHVYCGGTMRNKDLAKKFNLSPTHVSAIAHGRRRNHASSV